VTTERRGRVLVIRMDRTAKRNAVDEPMTRALDAALNELEDDPHLWCGVLTGGPQVFCAGTDLACGPGEPTARGGNYGVVRRERSTPLIAAVEGVAFGGGFEIVLACDLVVAGRSARFGLPEVAVGLVANCGALFRAPHALPVNVAKHMLLTGRPIDAARAHALGLVAEVVADGGAEDGALELADLVCGNAPVAVQATLQAVERVLGASDEHGWAATSKAATAVQGSADSVEGVSAFLEKRPPRWTGR
jgi:enoyl-CoA hydratase